jgi:hypothetical protein
VLGRREALDWVEQNISGRVPNLQAFETVLHKGMLVDSDYQITQSRLADSESLQAAR